MKPEDCRSLTETSQQSCFTIDTAIKQFNLMHSLVQLCFNIHYYHRPSCFEKDPECRTELPPQKCKNVVCIQFDEDNNIDGYLLMGPLKGYTI